MKRIEHEDEGLCGIENAREYARIHEGHAKMMYGPFLKEMKALGPKGKCLEVGAGPAIMTCLFAEANPDLHITASDISSDMASVAKERIRDKGLDDRIDYQICDANKKEDVKKLGKFDLVYSIYSLHHWDDPKKCISNLFGALKDDGVLYIGDLKRVWWLYYLPVKNRDTEQIRAAYMSREIKDILKRNGVTEYKIRALFPFFLQSVVISH